ncbi:hypothetical protein Esti_003705 [Eimeria stiedai]
MSEAQLLASNFVRPLAEQLLLRQQQLLQEEAWERQESENPGAGRAQRQQQQDGGLTLQQELHELTHTQQLLHHQQHQLQRLQQQQQQQQASPRAALRWRSVDISSDIGVSPAVIVATPMSVHRRQPALSSSSSSSSSSASRFLDGVGSGVALLPPPLEGASRAGRSIEADTAAAAAAAGSVRSCSVGLQEGPSGGSAPSSSLAAAAAHAAGLSAEPSAAAKSAAAAEAAGGGGPAAAAEGPVNLRVRLGPERFLHDVRLDDAAWAEWKEAIGWQLGLAPNSAELAEHVLRRAADQQQQQQEQQAREVGSETAERSSAAEELQRLVDPAYRMQRLEDARRLVAALSPLRRSEDAAAAAAGAAAAAAVLSEGTRDALSPRVSVGGAAAAAAAGAGTRPLAAAAARAAAGAVEYFEREGLRAPNTIKRPDEGGSKRPDEGGPLQHVELTMAPLLGLPAQESLQEIRPKTPPPLGAPHLSRPGGFFSERMQQQPQSRASALLGPRSGIRSPQTARRAAAAAAPVSPQPVSDSEVVLRPHLWRRRSLRRAAAAAAAAAEAAAAWASPMEKAAVAASGSGLPVPPRSRRSRMQPHQVGEAYVTGGGRGVPRGPPLPSLAMPFQPSQKQQLQQQQQQQETDASEVSPFTADEGLSTDSFEANQEEARQRQQQSQQQQWQQQQQRQQHHQPQQQQQQLREPGQGDRFRGTAPQPAVSLQVIRPRTSSDSEGSGHAAVAATTAAATAAAAAAGKRRGESTSQQRLSVDEGASVKEVTAAAVSPSRRRSSSSSSGSGSSGSSSSSKGQDKYSGHVEDPPQVNLLENPRHGFSNQQQQEQQQLVALPTAAAAASEWSIAQTPEAAAAEGAAQEAQEERQQPVELFDDWHEGDPPVEAWLSDSDGLPMQQQQQQQQEQQQQQQQKNAGKKQTADAAVGPSPEGAGGDAAAAAAPVSPFEERRAGALALPRMEANSDAAAAALDAAAASTPRSLALAGSLEANGGVVVASPAVRSVQRGIQTSPERHRRQRGRAVGAGGRGSRPRIVFSSLKTQLNSSSLPPASSSSGQQRRYPLRTRLKPLLGWLGEHVNYDWRGMVEVVKCSNVVDLYLHARDVGALPDFVLQSANPEKVLKRMQKQQQVALPAPPAAAAAAAAGAPALEDQQQQQQRQERQRLSKARKETAVSRKRRSSRASSRSMGGDDPSRTLKRRAGVLPPNSRGPEEGLTSSSSGRKSRLKRGIDARQESRSSKAISPSPRESNSPRPSVDHDSSSSSSSSRHAIVAAGRGDTEDAAEDRAFPAVPHERGGTLIRGGDAQWRSIGSGEAMQLAVLRQDTRFVSCKLRLKSGFVKGPDDTQNKEIFGVVLSGGPLVLSLCDEEVQLVRGSFFKVAPHEVWSLGNDQEDGGEAEIYIACLLLEDLPRPD